MEAGDEDIPGRRTVCSWLGAVPYQVGVSQCPGALAALALVSCGGEKPSLLHPDLHAEVDRGRRAALEWLGACILELGCLPPTPPALVL